MTAYGKEADRERSARAGFQLHLVKPVNPGDLLRLLEQNPLPSADDKRVIDIASFKKPASGADC